MRDVNIAITAASFSGNKGAAAMLKSSIDQLRERYGEQLNIILMSTYPEEDKKLMPYDFVDVISATPAQLVFVAFPIAVIYWLFKWCAPIKKILMKNRIVAAYGKADMVIDEAGVSFVDSRGFVMNTYAFISVATPALVGCKVVKYSQALGSFQNPYNRFLAKWILPHMELICARGDYTKKMLADIGVVKNVRLCADGAFTMKDSEAIACEVEKVCSADDFYRQGNVVGVSISSVVKKRCEKKKINYVAVMTEFINELNRQGYGVLLIANAARLGSKKTRNNDLPVGDEIYSGVEKKESVRWYHQEQDPEEIREYISKCRFLIASRFHAMIGALAKKVPVMLIGWSHKYKEVMDMFNLGQYASEFSALSVENLTKGFNQLVINEANIKKEINQNYEKVMASSYDNIRWIGDVLDDILCENKRRAKLLDYNSPETYIGNYIALRKGYSLHEDIRGNCASGGLVTSLLCNMLRHKDIDGAWVVKTAFQNGKLTYKTWIATDEKEIRDAATSVYLDIPLLKHIELLEQFNGKVAVIMTPCMLKALSYLIEKKPEIQNKVVLKIGLYCGGTYSLSGEELILEKAGILCEKAERLYYRTGHWRGNSSVVYAGGEEKSFSYKKYFCAYHNAFFFKKNSCMSCRDHYAEYSDISFGDIWLTQMKRNPLKYTSCVVRNDAAYYFLEQAVKDGDIHLEHMTGEDMIKSQKRALVYKYRANNDKTDGIKSKWNHKLAHWLAEKNRLFAENSYDTIKKIPVSLIYCYMCFIRLLLSF